MGNRLEAAANVAVIVSAVVVAFVATTRFWARPPQHPDLLSLLYPKGAAAPIAEGLDYSTANRTYVVVLSSSCEVCTASMPFYRQLAADVESSSGTSRFVVLVTEPTETARSYLTRHNLRVSILLHVQPEAVRSTPTPLLLLVDARGTIVQGWLGKLAAEAEKQVLSGVTQTLTRR